MGKMGTDGFCSCAAMCGRGLSWLVVRRRIPVFHLVLGLDRTSGFNHNLWHHLAAYDCLVRAFDHRLKYETESAAAYGPRIRSERTGGQTSKNPPQHTEMAGAGLLLE